MNTFNQFKILNVLMFLLIIIYTSMYFFYTSVSNYFLYVLLAFSFVFLLYTFRLMSFYTNDLVEANATLKKVANGDLYHRITEINKHNTFGKVSWNINNLLDQVETFNRDIESSMKSISTDTNRMMLSQGLHGDFVSMSKEINEVLSTLSLAKSKDAFIQSMLLTLNLYAKGDYRSSIDLEGMKEDTILLAKGINSLGESLSNLSYTNYENGLYLQKGSKILSSNISILNDATNFQAASLEETAASLEEITQSMVQSNQNTIKMSAYAKELILTAKNGEDLAKKTTLSMEAINNETYAIGEAITIIDKIAFQTNILSLNAAVEAATAGEAGKGFAVVAGEVRNLATRSAEAAKEIKSIVKNANNKTEEGKKNADFMIEGYVKLNEKINSTINLLNEVAHASKEQEEGIILINEAVTSLDQKTQQNAQISQETKNISEESYAISLKIIKAADKDFVNKEKIKV